MSERYVDDADWATAAEQSSEDDEAQEGNELAREEQASTSAEHVAIHVVDESADDDTDTSLDDVDTTDPEADAIVNDALNIDRTDEAEAAAEVLTDSLAEEETEREAEAADEVAPYDGPDVNGDEDEPAPKHILLAALTHDAHALGGDGAASGADGHESEHRSMPPLSELPPLSSSAS